MSLLCVALCAALCISPGFGYDIGPINGTVHFGVIYPKREFTPQDMQASKNLNGLLELVRKFLPVGIGDIVPPLDPYVKRKLYPAVFNNPDSDLNGTVELSNLVVTGAQGFVLDNVEVRQDVSRIDFNVTVSQVVADFDYLTSNFMYKQFVFNTSGHLQFVFKKLRIEGAMHFVTLYNLDYNFFFYTVIGLHADNYAEDMQIDKNLADIPLNVLDEVKYALLPWVGVVATEEMSDILKHYPYMQVLNFLYGNTL